jgi:hypothetical protein
MLGKRRRRCCGSAVRARSHLPHVGAAQALCAVFRKCPVHAKFVQADVLPGRHHQD